MEIIRGSIYLKMTLQIPSHLCCGGYPLSDTCVAGIKFLPRLSLIIKAAQAALVPYNLTIIEASPRFLEVHAARTAVTNAPLSNLQRITVSLPVRSGVAGF